MNSISASDVDVDLRNILHACQNYSDHLLQEEANTVCRKVALNKSILCGDVCIIMLSQNDLVLLHRQLI